MGMTMKFWTADRWSNFSLQRPARIPVMPMMKLAARANQTLADTLAGWSRLTPDMQQVLGVADQAGDYTNTLKRLADLYDDGF